MEVEPTPAVQLVLFFFGRLELLVGAGIVLVATGLLLIAASGDGMHDKMPGQVPPRRLAVIPLLGGVGCLVLAGMLALLP